MELKPPPALFLITPIVPLGGIVFIYGKSGVGKSPLSWALADALATGQPFLGLPTTSPTAALYLDVDTRWWTIQGRWAAAGYNPSFDIAVGDAFDCLAPSWLHSATRTMLIDLQQERGYKMVVISTLAKIHRLSFDPNAPNEVYKRWQEVFGEKCALVFVHHDKKSQIMDSKADPDVLYHTVRESFSGNQQWLDHCNTALHLTRRGSDYKFTLTQTKDQGSKQINPMNIVLADDGVGLSVETLPTQNDNWLGG